MIDPAATTVPAFTRPVCSALPTAGAGGPSFAGVLQGRGATAGPSATTTGNAPAAPAAAPAVAAPAAGQSATASPAVSAGLAALDGLVSERFGFEQFANLANRASFGTQGLRWR